MSEIISKPVNAETNTRNERGHSALSGQKTVARFVVDFLRNEGVRYVFGVPGGQPLAICDAIYDHDDIHFIATRHENAAAHAADAIGRLTGIPGVCLATTGPGATNLITGVGGAFRDSSPVIVITANNNRKDMLRDDAQDADHIALFQSLTKWSVLVSHPDHVHEILSEAFHRATTGNPGPVHIDFTRDVLLQKMPENARPVRRSMRTRILADTEQLGKAIDQLRNFRRPVLWAGNGVKISQARQEALELSEKFPIPVITTFNGIGAVPTTHDNVFGARSRMGSRLADEILAEADLLIAVGNSLNGPSTSRWTVKLPDEIIQIDIDASVIGRHYPNTLGVWGDAKESLNYILRNCSVPDDVMEDRKKWLEQLKERRTVWYQQYVDVPGYADKVPVKPQALIKAIGDHAPEGTIYCIDAGNPGIWSHILKIRESNIYMKPVGFGNMAFSLPAAIAAKLTHPERPVLCLVGDGSLGMSLAEIETAVRCKTPIVIVVMNDLAYGNIKQEQLRDFGPRYIGVDFCDIRYDIVAKGCGAEGERVYNIPAFLEALKRGLKSDKPYLIDVLIDPDESVWTKPF